MSQESPQVVLITGCSSGLGRALAYAFHSAVSNGQRAFKVYATARRLDSLKQLQEDGISVLALDVTDLKTIKACVATVLKECGRIDILVNNAGLLIPGPVAEQPVEELQRMFDANVWGALRMIQQVVPDMAKRRSGLIVNIGSVSAAMATPFAGGYSASKAALHAFNTSLSMELHPLGVRTLLVEAGSIKSSFGANAAGNVNTDRYASPGSLYHKAASTIKARAEMSQKDPKIMTSEETAKQILTAVQQANPPLRVRVAGNVWQYVLFGFLLWLVPAWMQQKLRARFGLNTTWKVTNY